MPPRPRSRTSRLRLLAAATGVLAFVFVLAAQAVWPDGEGEPVAWSDLSDEVGPLHLTGGTKRLFTSRAQLATYLDRLGAARHLPSVDFGRRQVLLISPGPRSSSGYRVEVLRVRRHDGRIDVTVRERTPTLGERVRASVTSPYRLLSLPRNADVYVDWRGR
ncbi:MAG TPA: protease complex subunit PrcB family protein [Gaiellaceae bacterium]|nr:protease complex subunit PrcB family protein [Gaiellaceae bacterium]